MNSDTDALAAEYVLGTLDAEERNGAQALLAADPDFAGKVKLWERRLGELASMDFGYRDVADRLDKLPRLRDKG